MTNYKETKEWYERTAMFGAAIGLGTGLSGYGAVTFKSGSHNIAARTFFTIMMYLGGSVAGAMMWNYYSEL